MNDSDLEALYVYWVGLPDPERWPEDHRAVPMYGHGFWAFCRGLQLGVALGALLKGD